jgi:hypothetical protein
MQHQLHNIDDNVGGWERLAVNAAIELLMAAAMATAGWWMSTSVDTERFCNRVEADFCLPARAIIAGVWLFVESLPEGLSTDAIVRKEVG